MAIQALVGGSEDRCEVLDAMVLAHVVHFSLPVWEAAVAAFNLAAPRRWANGPSPKLLLLLWG
eukprot:10256041-Lingulodinium_polyedra.AAC.1